MIVVSDSAPLIALALVGQFDLLKSLYGSVSIPHAVHSEVTGDELTRPGTKEVRDAEWLRVCNVQDRTAVALLRQQLDIGESEAIVLACQLEADALLIDEKKGRRIAQSQGLRVIGTVGTILLAKQRTLIDEVTPLLMDLQDAGFRMSPSLFRDVQRMAGE